VSRRAAGDRRADRRYQPGCPRQAGAERGDPGWPRRAGSGDPRGRLVPGAWRRGERGPGVRRVRRRRGRAGFPQSCPSRAPR